MGSYCYIIFGDEFLDDVEKVVGAERVLYGISHAFRPKIKTIIVCPENGLVYDFHNALTKLAEVELSNCIDVALDQLDRSVFPFDIEVVLKDTNQFDHR